MQKKACIGLVFILIFLVSCIGWLDQDQFKSFLLNDIYEVSYYKESPRQKVKKVELERNCRYIVSDVIELVYNDEYIYAHSSDTLFKDAYYKIKATELKEEALEITKEQYIQFKHSCSNCRIIDIARFNEIDKDLPSQGDDEKKIIRYRYEDFE